MKFLRELLVFSLCCICFNAHAGKKAPYIHKMPDLHQQKQQALLTSAKHLQKISTAPTARFESRHPVRRQVTASSTRQKVLGLLFLAMMAGAENTHSAPYQTANHTNTTNIVDPLNQSTSTRNATLSSPDAQPQPLQPANYSNTTSSIFSASGIHPVADSYMSRPTQIIPVAPLASKPHFNTTHETLVDKELDKIAKDNGYKYANLVELAKLTKDPQLQARLNPLDVTVNVPAFIGISSSDINAFLEAKGLNLKIEWKGIVEKTLSQDIIEKAFSDKKLPQKFATAMEKFSSNIESFFEKKAKAIENCGMAASCLKQTLGQASFIDEIYRFLEAAKKAIQEIIVRSTGMEDRKNVTNAGGNESFKFVKPNFPDILRAIGKVIASYFLPKSLSQRLIAGDKTVFYIQPTPVLLQIMVTSKKRPLECVIHTTEQNGQTPNLASFNCGYGIVASEQRGDQYFCNSYTGQCHSILAKGVEHLTPELEQALTTLAAHIQQHYQRPMDIELLITINDDKTYTIHFVQTRPLNLPVKIEKESYITNIDQLEKQNIIAATTVVPAGSSVRHISMPQQIIVAQTLNAALIRYLEPEIDKTAVLAVVVQGQAEPNSHEATTFASDGKLVMIARDYEKLSQWLTQPSLNLYLDAQQAKILNPETTQLIVKPGYITHPMPKQVSIVKEKQVTLPFTIKDGMPEVGTPALIKILKQGSQVEALSALVPLLARIDAQIALQKNSIACIGTTENCPLRAIAADALARLDTLGRFAMHKAYDALQFLSMPAYDLQRLAAILPLEALLTQPEDPQLENVYSLASISEEFAQRKAFLEQYILPELEESHISPAILSNLQLLDAARMGHSIAITPKLKKDWLNFVGILAQDKTKSRVPAFIEMTNELINLNAFSAWITILFSNAITNDQRSILNVLYQRNIFDVLYTEYKKAKPFLQTLKDIQSHVNSLNSADWSDPPKFDALLKDLQEEVFPFILSEKFLSIFSEQTLFGRLFSKSKKLEQVCAYSFMSTFIDTFDNKFIKTFFSSTLYQAKEQKVQNFRKIVLEYFSVLKKWESLTTFRTVEYKGYSELSSYSFKNYIEKLEEGISCTSTTNPKELEPSQDFSVAAEIYVNIVKSQQAQLRDFDFSKHTLAAFFTLVHQNINSILTNLAVKIGLDQFQRPSLLQSIESEILTLQSIAYVTSRPFLIGVKFDDETTILTYNLPLKLHGLTYDIIYNANDNSAKLVITFVGLNDDCEEQTIAFIKDVCPFLKISFLETSTNKRDMNSKGRANTRGDMKITLGFSGSSKIEHLSRFLDGINQMMSEIYGLNDKITREELERYKVYEPIIPLIKFIELGMPQASNAVDFVNKHLTTNSRTLASIIKNMLLKLLEADHPNAADLTTKFVNHINDPNIINSDIIEDIKEIILKLLESSDQRYVDLALSLIDANINKFTKEILRMRCLEKEAFSIIGQISYHLHKLSPPSQRAIREFSFW